jgi:hypothetical protein
LRHTRHVPRWRQQAAFFLRGNRQLAAAAGEYDPARLNLSLDLLPHALYAPFTHLRTATAGEAFYIVQFYILHFFIPPSDRQLAAPVGVHALYATFTFYIVQFYILHFFIPPTPQTP